MERSEIIGYHGTSEENAKKIVTTNFKRSENPDDWLGYGVYFFVNGISDPIANAKEWAMYKAWNGNSKPALYSRYNVLSAKVVGANILDTNKIADLKAFNLVRNRLLEIHKEHWCKDRKVTEDDRLLWNFAADFMKLDVIIHNLYIKNKTQRIKKIASNIPNVTVMCVKDVANIDIDTINKEKEGRVKL